MALLIDTSTGWGRNIIRGVDRYAKEVGNWELSVQPYAQVNHIPLPPNWSGDGVIARIASEKMADDLKKSRIPVVNVSSIELSGFSTPRVIPHFEHIGKLVAEHFIERGFRNFAFCGYLEEQYSSFGQYYGFSSTLKKCGFPCEILRTPRTKPSPAKQQERLLKWLRRQERPLAIFAWSIDAPREIAAACRYGGIPVPEEVAIVSGASPDELILQVENPSISCVATSERSIGYSAAGLLKRMMDNSKSVARDKTLVIEPSHVEERASSDIMAVQDPELVKALRYIRETVSASIGVDDVARHAGLSRRSLEQKMRKKMQRSPGEEIRLVRLLRAKSLLCSTHLAIPDVAEKSGFGTVEHFITFFRKETGLTPLQYSKTYHID